MKLGLDGKVAVVTGASKGIGLAVAQAMVAEGAHVVAGARDTSPELALLADSGQVDVVVRDLSDPDAPGELVAAAGSRVDILVNNVGVVQPRLEGFLSVTDDEWLASLTLNLLVAVRTCRAALPLMVSAGSGTIVNIGSVNAFLPDPLVIDYSVAKAGLVNFAKSLSKEFGPHGIRVNTIAPGPVATPLWLGVDGVAAKVSRASGLTPSDVAASAVQGAATGRFTQPQEVADLVLVLASDRTANVTGSNVAIDGGLITTL